jgi:predicted  nucleic acid-binding Zn-ribbon protein
MARGRGGIRIPIITEFDDKAIKGFASSVEGLGKGLTKGLTVPILAVGTALGVMVKGAIEAEAVQNRLRQILLTTGGATEKQVGLLLEQAKALEKVGVVSKENIITTQSQLATFDLQASTISKLTPAILDYVTAEKGARASSEDFKSMTNSLAQALNGQFGGLTRVGFVLDDHTKKLISSGTEAERAEAIVSVLNSTYEGFNETLLNTPEGQLIKLEQEFSNLKDEIGKALIPVMGDLVIMIRTYIVPIAEKAAFAIKTLADRFLELDDNTKKQIVGIVLFAAVLGPALVLVASLIRAITLLAGAFLLLTKAVLIIPVGILLLIGAFRAQSDAQYKLAVETGSTWKQIAIAIEKAIEFILIGVENFVNGLQVAALAYSHLGYLIENRKLFNNKDTGIDSFSDRLKDLVDNKFVNFRKGATNISSTLISFGTTVSQIKTEIDGFSNSQTGAVMSSAELEAEIKSLQAAMNQSGGTTEKKREKTEKLKDTMVELRKAIVDLKQQAVDKLKDSLTQAMRELENAQSSYDAFKKSITTSLTSTIDFGKAAEKGNFVAGLVGQANQAKEFAAKIKTLIKMGLSESAIQEILKQGAVAGSKIADEIIAGGQTIVKKVNKLMASVEKVATDVGTLGANQFYLAGVTQGQALVNGILAALAAGQEELVAAQNALATGGAVNTTGFPGGALQQALWDEATRTNNKRALALLKEFTAGGSPISKAELEALQALGIGLGLTHPSERRMAKGGIVLGPTNALIGEAGPEAVVPLSGANSAKLGTTYNITVNAGMGTDGEQVGRKIIEAIRRYERSNGPVFARS